MFELEAAIPMRENWVSRRDGELHLPAKATPPACGRGTAGGRFVRRSVLVSRRRERLGRRWPWLLRGRRQEGMVLKSRREQGEIASRSSIERIDPDISIFDQVAVIL